MKHRVSEVCPFQDEQKAVLSNESCQSEF